MSKNQIKRSKRQNKEYIILRLNLYNASLLICGIAFLCRYMWYGKVEETNAKQFYDNEDFEDYYSVLRMLLGFLNEKCKETFEGYKEYKINK